MAKKIGRKRQMNMVKRGLQLLIKDLEREMKKHGFFSFDIGYSCDLLTLKVGYHTPVTYHPMKMVSVPGLATDYVFFNYIQNTNGKWERVRHEEEE